MANLYLNICHAGNRQLQAQAIYMQQLCCATFMRLCLQPIFDHNICGYSPDELEHTAAAVLTYKHGLKCT